MHERLKRLRAAKRLRGTVALLGGEAVGKQLLAFVHFDTEGWGKTQALMELAELPELEEIRSMTGDTRMLLKIHCAGGRSGRCCCACTRRQE